MFKSDMLILNILLLRFLRSVHPANAFQYRFLYRIIGTGVPSCKYRSTDTVVLSLYSRESIVVLP